MLRNGPCRRNRRAIRNHTARHRALLLALPLLLVVVTSACSGGGNGGAVQATPSGSSPPSVAASGHGLLIPRDQRLLLRDMSTEKEYVLRGTQGNIYYTFPRWSPDGSRIAYALDVSYTGLPNQDWGSDIAVASVSGTLEEQIIFRHPSPGVQVQGLAWAPDGAHLYASLMETTFKDGRLLGQTLNLERINLATGERQVIVPNATYPSVSPDGSVIAYVTFGSADDTGGLWVARSDGSDRRLLVPASGTFVVVTNPRFSPDGSTIAFSAATLASGVEQPIPGRPAPGPGLNAERTSAHGLPQDIWLIAATGGEPKRITNMLEDEPTVAWSPDGGRIAIIATGGLYVMNVNGGEPRKIGLGGTLVQIDWR